MTLKEQSMEAHTSIKGLAHFTGVNGNPPEASSQELSIQISDRLDSADAGGCVGLINDDQRRSVVTPPLETIAVNVGIPKPQFSPELSNLRNDRVTPIHASSCVAPSNDDQKMKMFIDMKQLPEIVRLCKSTILSRVKDGTFPAPVRLSARRIAWLESDVMNWINSLPKVGAA
jgi:prophage regulatory protein